MLDFNALSCISIYFSAVYSKSKKFFPRSLII